MRLLLVAPAAKSKFLGKSFAFHLPFLSLPILATYTPEDVDLTIIDERSAEIDFNVKYDLVGITVMTPLAPRGYEIAQEFRKRGVKVVMGGMHVSALPDEVAQHADSIVIGEGEKVWPQVIEDFKRGELKAVYRSSDFTNLNTMTPVRRNLLNPDKYAPVEFIETTRGCPFGCHFCSVTRFFGGKYRTRSVDDVIKEISSIKFQDKRFSIRNVVFFVDDNVIGNRAHAIELFNKIKPFKLNWLGQTSMNFAKDEEMMRLARESGCMGVLVGFESLSDDVLKDVGKKPNATKDFQWAIDRIQSHGIGVLGSFIFGFDQDDPTVFQRYWDFVKDSKLAALYVGIMTPYPGTRFYDDMKAESRIFDFDWSHYDTSHVVFQPKKMSVKQLQEGYKWAWRKSYSWNSLYRRLYKTKAYPMFFWPMNIGFKLSVGRLLKELD